jgi:hypothetical protein
MQPARRDCAHREGDPIGLTTLCPGSASKDLDATSTLMPSVRDQIRSISNLSVFDIGDCEPPDHPANLRHKQ